MAYLRCEACGSKALSAASQCPRCAAPFDLTDARGFRAPLKQCRGCGIMHRRDRSCHWCGDRKQSAWLSTKLWSRAAAVAVMSLATAGAYNYRGPIGDTASSVMARAFAAPRAEESAPANASRNSVQPTAPVEAATRLMSMNSTIDLDAPSPTNVDPNGISSGISDGTMVATVSDSIVWIPAVARTWVNVRDDAGRGGNVVGVINPSSRAMLGTTRAGWRQVKSTDVTGWVDPRLFEPDSLRTRGL